MSLTLREALRLALNLGCTVEQVRGTGEVRVSHPMQSRTVRLNSRRHDAPKVLMVLLRRAATYDRVMEVAA